MYKNLMEVQVENSGWRWRFGIPQFRVVVHMLRMPKLPQGAKGTAEGREAQRMNSHKVPGEEELRQWAVPSQRQEHIG